MKKEETPRWREFETERASGFEGLVISRIPFVSGEGVVEDAPSSRAFVLLGANFGYNIDEDGIWVFNTGSSSVQQGRRKRVLCGGEVQQ